MKPILDRKALAEFEEIRSQMEVSSNGRRVSDQDVVDMICRATKRMGTQTQRSKAMLLLQSVSKFAEPTEMSAIRTRLPNFSTATLSNFIYAR